MFTQNHLAQRVKDIVSRVTNIPVSELSDDAHIQNELGIDSIAAMEILARCEIEFSVELNESHCMSLETLGEFVDYLEEKLRE